MSRWCVACVFGVALALVVGCGKKDGGGGAAEAPGAAASAGLDFEQAALSFPFRQGSDGREMTFRVEARIPKGWTRPNPDLAELATFVPPQGEGAAGLSTSTLNVSATCHGMCRKDRLAENASTTKANRLAQAGAGGRKAALVKDEALEGGRTVYVIESTREDGAGRRVNFGVTHRGEDWEQVVFCEAMLEEPWADRWEALLQACLDLDVTIVDPLLPPETLAREEALLAQCPPASAVAYTGKKEGDEVPAFVSVQTAVAEAPGPGVVVLWLANAALPSTDLRENPLQEGQVALRIELTHNEKGEIVSGVVPPKYEQPTRAGAGLHIAGGRSFPFDAWKTEGEVKVVARTRKKICGTFSLEDPWRKVEGAFVADLR